MDLQRAIHRFCTVVQILSLCFGFFLFSIGPAAAQGKRPELIRDTEETNTTEAADVPVLKEPNPLLSEQSVNIGDFYYKKKNYEAAIRRYLEAIEYQPNSARAYDSLARAYAKNDEPTKAIAAYKEFVEKNPDSPKSSEFRSKLEKLQKNSR
jgi:pentatricopeptide repeat protein